MKSIHSKFLASKDACSIVSFLDTDTGRQAGRQADKKAGRYLVRLDGRQKLRQAGRKASKRNWEQAGRLEDR